MSKRKSTKDTIEQKRQKIIQEDPLNLGPGMTIETARTRIRRVGKAAQLVCRIFAISFVIAAILMLIGAGMTIVNDSFAAQYGPRYQNAPIYRVLQWAAGIYALDEKYQYAIAWTISAVSMLFLFFFTRQLMRFVNALITEDRIFTHEGAVKMRKAALMFIPVLFASPHMAVAMSLITVLFSYIFDYGAILQARAAETDRIQQEMIVSFAEITENKSGQTGNHIKRVAEYTKLIAEEMGYSQEEAEKLSLASTMHDIGKLMIPSEILDKPGKLTDEEYKIIKMHTTYGGQLLENVEGEVMQLSREIALEHHERVDGRGYPEGKTEVSPAGRIVAVADVYDALTSKRSYKNAWDPEAAKAEIVKNSGTQFDAQVVTAFSAAYDRILKIHDHYMD